MNQINPKKLLLSKWTATKPQNKEMHFMVVKVTYDEDDKNRVTDCLIEAVLTKRSFSIDWHALKDEANWKAGW